MCSDSLYQRCGAGYKVKNVAFNISEKYCSDAFVAYSGRFEYFNTAFDNLFAEIVKIVCGYGNVSYAGFFKCSGVVFARCTAEFNHTLVCKGNKICTFAVVVNNFAVKKLFVPV